jgi:hypothetical protein
MKLTLTPRTVGKLQARHRLANLAQRLGYADGLLDSVPEEAVESFAGVGRTGARAYRGTPGTLTDHLDTVLHRRKYGATVAEDLAIIDASTYSLRCARS